jgi:hypothetical protein
MAAKDYLQVHIAVMLYYFRVNCYFSQQGRRSQQLSGYKYNILCNDLI